MDIRKERLKKLKFELSKKEFNSIKSMNCYLCGKENNKGHTNGIDRIDSNKGYEIDNVLPCCANCNYLKKDYLINDLVLKLYQIYVNSNKIKDTIDNDKIIDIISKYIENMKKNVKYNIK